MIGSAKAARGWHKDTFNRRHELRDLKSAQNADMAQIPEAALTRGRTVGAQSRCPCKRMRATSRFQVLG